MLKITAWFLLCTSFHLFAAPSQKQNGRRKIGVALAGGSALGFSHVGVIKWLEEHRIPIDYIAGTSMGGLVAGIHATGMSSEEMIAFVRKIDWKGALSTSAPYSNLSFRRKEDASQFPISFEMGLKNGKLNLPSGLSNGEGVSLVIERFAAPYGDMESFDRLPTPFRCVASDLISGKSVIFREGSLYDALRATMSLPGLFAPVRKDGMVLVDGGLTNNLPVEVVRSMGADIVIAVALDIPVDPKDFQSLLGIASRSISNMVAANERPSLAAADIVVMPSLKGMSVSSFDKWEDFGKLGYEAAEKKATMLEMLRVSEEEFAEWRKERQARRRPNTIHPKRIDVQGEVAPKLKQALIADVRPPGGAPVNREILEEHMEKLTGLGRFATATYEFRTIGGEESLLIKVTEKQYGPPLLRPVILIDGANGEGLRFGAGARLTFLDFGGPASEWRTDLTIGTFNRVESELYYRLRGGKWFVAPRGGYSQDRLPVFTREGDKLAQFTDRDVFGALDAGYAFGRWQELRFGHQIGYVRTSLNTGTVDNQLISGQYGRNQILIRRDTRDDAIIPHNGIYAVGRAAWYNRYPLVNRQFAAFDGSFRHAYSFHPKYTLLSRFSAAGTASEPGLVTLFRLGGLTNLSALSRNQLYGTRLYYGSAYLLRALPISSGSRFYGMVGYEAGQAWTERQSARPRHDGIIGLTTATPFGGLFIGGAFGDRGDHKILFRFGRIF